MSIFIARHATYWDGIFVERCKIGWVSLFTWIGIGWGFPRSFLVCDGVRAFIAIREMGQYPLS